MRGGPSTCKNAVMKTCFALLLPAILLVATTEAEEAGSNGEALVIQSEDGASLESNVGQDVVVEGMVRNVGTGPNDNITFLNFGQRGSGFVAVIFRAAYDKFPEGFEGYAGQKVRVRGMLEKYRDRQPQIKVITPDQLEIVSPEP